MLQGYENLVSSYLPRVILNGSISDFNDFNVTKMERKMIERAELLTSIVETTADYRQSTLAPPGSEHVDRWVKQFDDSVQLPILQEVDHVLKKTYLTKESEEISGICLQSKRACW